MNGELKNIEIERARVRLEREKLLLQRDLASVRPKPNKFRRYLIGVSLAIVGIYAFGIYHVEESNRCDSWRHARWLDLLSEELKKDPAKYQRYMETVGRIKLSQAPETWAGARGVFPYMVNKTAESGLVDPRFIDDTAQQVRLESIGNLGCPR